MGLDPRWLAKIDPIRVRQSVVVRPITDYEGEVADPHQPFVILSKPPSVNNMFDGKAQGGRRLSAEARRWYDENMPVAARLPVATVYPIRIFWVVEEWLHGSADVGNLDKAIQDVLKKAGVIADDGNRYVRGCTYDYCPREGGRGVRVWWEPTEAVAEKPKKKGKRR